jgi:hypothetical protein
MAEVISSFDKVVTNVWDLFLTLHFALFLNPIITIGDRSSQIQTFGIIMKVCSAFTVSEGNYHKFYF